MRSTRHAEIYEFAESSEDMMKTYGVLAEIAERRGRPDEARAWRRKEQETFAAFAGSETQLPKWADSVAQAVAAACQGNAQAGKELEPFLQRIGQTDNWRALPPVITRIMAGERDLQDLTDELDHLDALIIRRILERLAEQAGE